MNRKHHHPLNNSHKVLVVFHKGEYCKLDLRDVVYIEARRSNSILFLKNRVGGIALSSSIGTLVKQLPPHLFCQVNRSYVIGLEHLVKVNRKKTRVYLYADKILAVTPAFTHSLLENLFILR